MKQEITPYVWPGLVRIVRQRIVGGEPLYIPDVFRPREISEPVGKINYRHKEKAFVSGMLVTLVTTLRSVGGQV